MMNCVQTLDSEHESRLLKNDAAHGLTVRPPNRDRLTMRVKPLKKRATSS